MKLPALKDIKPNQVSKTENNNVVFDINTTKAKKTITNSDLNINDRVRIKITKKFTKSSDIQFSDQIYKVINIEGGNITLDNNQIVKRAQVLKVSTLTQSQTVPNVITQANKSHKVDRVLKSDGIDQSNIITTGRRKK